MNATTKLAALLTLPILGGCLPTLLSGDASEAEAVGTSVACLDTTADASAYADSDGALHVSGHIVPGGRGESGRMDTGVHPCWTRPDRTLQIEDEDGEIWTLGYGWMDADGWGVTPEVWVGPRAEIEMVFRADDDSDAAGFAIYVDGELLYALESGRDGQGLQQGDVPEIDVQETPTDDSRRDDCGRRWDLALEFESEDDRRQMKPGEDVFDFRVGRKEYTLCNIDSFEYEDAACSAAQESSWVVFR